MGAVGLEVRWHNVQRVRGLNRRVLDMVKIGIVDDDREYAETMAYILREAGYEVTYTDSIEGLVDKLLVNMPDLLIVDIMFPVSYTHLTLPTILRV